MNKKILILVDYLNNFWISIPDLQNFKSMDTELISNLFRERGYVVELVRYEDIDFSKKYNDYIVLYQSTEDLELNYKSYIEDIILWLKCQGALIIPDFIYLRAHHNKNMMELIRKGLGDTSFKTIETEIISTYETIEDKKYKNYPLVVKTASGAGSNGVLLVKNKKELLRKLRSATRVFSRRKFSYSLMKLKRKLLRQPIIESINDYNNNKFIIQSFIKNLTGDYKVLIFNEKYYILHRKNRENDFRASGSGIYLEPIDEEINGLLDFARKLFQELKVPVLSIDIGCSEGIYHLIEFQCIHFGPYTLQASEYYYINTVSGWEKILGKSELEKEFVISLDAYLQETTKSHKNNISNLEY